MSIILYRYNGSRQIFNLDLVQFLYLTLFGPLLFIWAKSFLFVLLRSELPVRLTLNELFIIDTAFSVISFFLFSSLAVHSLTKTFWLRRREDPDLDIFHLSEYFHLWWSHIVMFGGAMVVTTLISSANLFSPFDVPLEFVEFSMTPVVGAGFLMGVLFFVLMVLSDPKQGGFMRLMRIGLGFFFALHVVYYFVIEPSFSLQFGGYWSIFSLFLAGVVCSILFDKSDIFEYVENHFSHEGWGENISLFERAREQIDHIQHEITKKR